MNSALDISELRFARYCDEVLRTISDSRRSEPARHYLAGLLLPGGRKSVEPMAERLCGDGVSSLHQSMHHFVAQSAWCDAAVMASTAQQVMPVIVRAGQARSWVIESITLHKKGHHSVGITKLHSEHLGRPQSCRIAVSLALASKRGTLPLSFQLYLPKIWADNTLRRKLVGVPDAVRYSTKGEIALAQIDSAIAEQTPHGLVLAGASYGAEVAFREGLRLRGLDYIVGVNPLVSLFFRTAKPAEQSVPACAHELANAPCGCAIHLNGEDCAVAPLKAKFDFEVASAADIAMRCYRQDARCAGKTVMPQIQQFAWFEGGIRPVQSRFARVRVHMDERAAEDAYGCPREDPYSDADGSANRAQTEQWLIIEWANDTAQATAFWLSSLPKHTPFDEMVNAIKSRWRVRRDYAEITQKFGLEHYEGRNWRGFHHHASLCIAAYGFALAQRLSRV